MKPFSIKSKLGLRIMSLIRGYNHDKYWRRRSVVIDPENKTPLIVKLYYLFYIKRVDARFGCSFGTNLHSGSKFATPPFLPHGPYGIICGHDWEIGEKCIMYQQVTLAGGGKIGNRVELGAGVKVLDNVTIGNNVHVGLNAVVIEDIPDGATVVLHRPRIITAEEKTRRKSIIDKEHEV